MSVALASLVFALIAQQAPASTDPVALELETRRLALAGSCKELAEVVAGAANGPSAVARLDAVRRGRAAGTLTRASADADGWARLVAAAQARVPDGDQGVRAAALEALAALAAPPGGGAARDALARVRAEPVARVRLAWVRCLAVQPDTAPALLALAADPEPEVASAARLALIAHPERSEEQVETLCRALVAQNDEQGLLELALGLERCGATPRLLIKLAGVCEAGFGGDAGVQRSWAALFHAVTLRLHKFVAPHGLAFPHVIVGGWLGDPKIAPDSRRNMLLLRAARLGGPSLAEGFIHAAAAAGTPDERNAYLVGAVEALDPQSLVNGVLALADLGPEVRLELWSKLGSHARRWDFDETRAWLGTSDPALRAVVVSVIAATYAQYGDGGSKRLLRLALADSEPAIALDAFRALCAPAYEEDIEILHAAWSARPTAERYGAWLEPLPRRAGLLTSFRAELLAAGAERGRRGVLAELLADFDNDAEVAGALRAWTSGELARLRSSGASPDRSEELIAVACLNALAFNVEGEVAAAPWLESIVTGLREELPRARDAATRDALIAIGRNAVYWLGQSAQGQATLAALLDESVPQRLRVEAALVLGPRGDEEAAAWITRDYQALDEELRTRCLGALGSARGTVSLEFLLSLVGDDGEQVRDPGREPLVRVAVVALANRAKKVDDAATRSRIESNLMRLARDAESPDVRREALTQLPAQGATPSSVPAELEARIPELDPSDAFALGTSFLRKQPDLAARLLRAGWIGLMAGPEHGVTWPALNTRDQLIALAEAQEEWGTVAMLTEDLVADWRAGFAGEWAFTQHLDNFDPRLGQDEPARIAAAALQARSHEALAAGDRARAELLAQQARAAVGFSRAALDAQDALERRLAEAR